MKTTYHTTGFLADESYSGGILQFMQQYQDRFPGISYLHLSLEEYVAAAGTQNEQLHYYGDGKCLKIYLAKWSKTRMPTHFEVYEELRFVFDCAVEEHLRKHENEFFASNYCR